jgi:putative transposase
VAIILSSAARLQRVAVILSSAARLQRVAVIDQSPAKARQLICGDDYLILSILCIILLYMSEFRKANTDKPCFVTLTVVGWIDIFTRMIYSEIVLDSFEYCRLKKGLKIYGFVIMPSRIHLVCSNTEYNLPAILRDMKSYTAKRIIKSIEEIPGESRKNWLLHMFRYHAEFQKQNQQYQFWQKTNHPLELNFPDIFLQKLNYIHQNPVKEGYVNQPEEWRYSSANPMCRFKVDER